MSVSSFLRRLVYGPPPPGRDERSVFAYWDGTRRRVTDPMTAWYALDEASGGAWREWLGILAVRLPPAPPGVDEAKLAPIRAADEATKKDLSLKIAAAVSAAFDVPPLTEVKPSDAPPTPSAPRVVIGLALLERIALASAYLDYMGGLAGAAKAHPTTASPSATG